MNVSEYFKNKKYQITEDILRYIAKKQGLHVYYELKNLTAVLSKPSTQELPAPPAKN